MKITRLRMNGKKLDQSTEETLGALLVMELRKSGYITDHVGLQKIGMHMKSFIIDTEELGYNKRVNSWDKSPVGFKRTSTPTWEQREDFNHIINAFFDRHDLSAKIKSGAYLVRCHEEGAITEWCDVSGNDYGFNSVEISELTEEDAQHAKDVRAELARKRRTEKKHREFQLKLVVNN